MAGVHLDFQLVISSVCETPSLTPPNRAPLTRHAAFNLCHQPEAVNHFFGWPTAELTRLQDSMEELNEFCVMSVLWTTKS